MTSISGHMSCNIGLFLRDDGVDRPGDRRHIREPYRYSHVRRGPPGRWGWSCTSTSPERSRLVSGGEHRVRAAAPEPDRDILGVFPRHEVMASDRFSTGRPASFKP